MRTAGRKVIVVGGGPAGLTAALYLARFHLSVFLADAQQSRAALIPFRTIRPDGQEAFPDRSCFDEFGIRSSNTMLSL